MLYRHIHTGALIETNSALEGDWQALQPASPAADQKPAPAKPEKDTKKPAAPKKTTTTGKK